MSDETENVEEQAEEPVEEAAEETPEVEAEETKTEEADPEETDTGETEPEKEPDPRSKPPVIDLETLLKPISDENPAGESVRYSGVYDEINEARRADDDLNLGEWEHELKVADYKKVIEIATNTLANETKDLQIAAWLSESLIREHGFAGLRDSLKLMSGLIDNFWETAFPEVDEGDEEGRANAIEWMDREAAFSTLKAPITERGYGLMDYRDAKTFDIPDNIEALDTAEREKFTELKEIAEKQNRTTADKWKVAVASSKRAFYEELDFVLKECWEEYETLNKVAEKWFDPKQAASMNDLKKALEDIQTRADKLLDKKRGEEPDPVDEYAEMEDGVEGENRGGNAGGFSAGGAIKNRAQALSRLTEVAKFFSQTEPHSPVSYLVNRAVKWGRMPLDSWLTEVIKDETVLGQLRETLGFGSGGAEDAWGEENNEGGEEAQEAAAEEDW
ncbi:MAG: type VI secretion system protein TssA [Pyrinomonadaceae bacterium]|nr:type VI secretion system protein TssA [Pyrinomonadaceae bacterium]